MITNKKFIHFGSFENFNTKKLSASKNDDFYTIGISTRRYAGEPDYSYDSIIFIKDSGYIFTHGKLYDSSGEAIKLKEAVKINGTDFDGSQNITTEVWGRPVDISVSDAPGINNGPSSSIGGGNNVTLKLPEALDIKVSKDYEGNRITDTYATKRELWDGLDELPSFYVYSGESDDNPTLDSYPSNQWDTIYLKEEHSGDYYVTTTGRIFQFYEDSDNIWGWREITDYYLYRCLESLKTIENKLEVSGRWGDTQTELETGNIYINNVLNSGLPYLDVVSCGSSITYKLTSGVDLYLPYIYGGNSVRTMTRHKTTSPRPISFSDLGLAIGKSIMIYNSPTSMANLHLKYCDNSGTPRMMTLEPGKVGLSKLCTRVISGYLCFYWDIQDASPSNPIWS